MKYMLMIISDEEVEAARTPGEIEQLVERYGAVARELRTAGKLLAAERLRFSAQATTIRRRGEDCALLDGPFVETKELLGGFYLIEADSKEEAVEWAKKLPLDESGAVEVRPAMTGAQWRGPPRGKHKYVILLVASQETLARQTQEQLFQSIDYHYELSLELAARAQFVGARGLGGHAGAATVRSENGKTVVTDGPFAETKELVAGYFVVACDTKDEAIELGQKLLFGLDAVEVRPVWEAS